MNPGLVVICASPVPSGLMTNTWPPRVKAIFPFCPGKAAYAPRKNARVSAGVWTFAVSVTTTGADAVGAAPTLSAYVYRRSAAGTYTALFNATSGTFSATVAATATVTWSSTSQPALILATDETVHVEFWCNAQGVALTGNTYVANIGAITAVTFPLVAGQGTGVVADYPRSGAATAVGVTALTRGVALARASTATGIAAFTRTITAARAFATVATGLTALTRTVGVNRAGTATGLAAMGRAAALNRSYATTATGVTALTRRTGKTFTATAVGVAASTRRVTASRAFTAVAVGFTNLGRAVIAARTFTATAVGVASGRADIPLAVLGRISVGGPADYSPNDGAKSIAGLVRATAGGAPVVGASVRLIRESDNFIAATTTSGAGGTYAFPRDGGDPNTYTVLVFSGTATGGVSRRGVVPS